MVDVRYCRDALLFSFWPTTLAIVSRLHFFCFRNTYQSTISGLTGLSLDRVDWTTHDVQILHHGEELASSKPGIADRQCYSNNIRWVFWKVSNRSKGSSLRPRMKGMPEPDKGKFPSSPGHQWIKLFKESDFPMFVHLNWATQTGSKLNFTFLLSSRPAKALSSSLG